MKFDRSLTKFVEKNVYRDVESKNAFEFFYSEFYFRTTEELQMYKSIINSKMKKNNSTAIFLSLIALISSFSMAFVNLLKDFFDKETNTATLIGMIFLFGVFIAVYFTFFIINGIDASLTWKHKKMSLMIEAIEKILEERKENEN